MGQTNEEIQIKKDLMKVFHKLEVYGKDNATIESLEFEALKLESMLHKIIHDKIKKYENNIQKNKETINAINSGVVKI